MDDDERLGHIVKAAGQLDELVAFAKTELALNDDPAARDVLLKMLPDLERMSDDTRDLLSMRAVLAAFSLHGSGPWSVEQLAALTERDQASVERVLHKLSSHGDGHFA